MHIAYAAEHERLRAELRDYFGELMTPERRASLGGTASTATGRPTWRSSGSWARTAG